VTKRRKAAAIVAVLDRLYPRPPVPLRHSDAYTLLVAAVLSAHSSDACVNRVTPKLFRRAGSAGEMLRLSRTEIEHTIRPCGLAPAKARHIRELSKMLVVRHKGAVPASFEALEALPGVGHKTASVIMAQVFGVPAFPIDTHIHRLAFRWGLSDGRSVHRTEADLKAVFPRRRWNRLHLQMIYYGREYCPARGHRLDRCLICRKYGIRRRLSVSFAGR
jgi:endonuclease-3